jgi:hypothetical protein
VSGIVNVAGVGVEHAVPAPPVIRRRRRARERRVADAAEHAAVNAQRDPRAGLAPGRRREALARQVPHLGARRVPVHDLLDEQRERRGRVELAVAPRVLQLAADVLDHGGVERGDVLFDPRERVVDTGHPWPPVECGD